MRGSHLFPSRLTTPGVVKLVTQARHSKSEPVAAKEPESITAAHLLARILIRF